MSEVRDAPLVLTKKIIQEYFKRVGHKFPESCPRCGYDGFDKDEDPEGYVYHVYPFNIVKEAFSVPRPHSNALGVFTQDCDNCGYAENYHMLPFMRDWLNNNG